MHDIPHIPTHSEHHIFLLDDPAGKFVGALVPARAPLDTTSQWQALLDTTLQHAVRSEPTGNIDGLYAFSFSKDPNPDHSGILLTRLSNNVADAIASSRLPHHSLGLVAIISEPDTGARTAICALLGGVVPDTYALRPNRILAAICDTHGNPIPAGMTNSSKIVTRAIGHVLLERLDRHVETAVRTTN
jgi:hypothetical protein